MPPLLVLFVIFSLFATQTLSALNQSSYTVEPKDNWYSIGRKFQVAPQDLALWNGKTLATSLHPGDVLVLSPKSQPSFPTQPKRESPEETTRAHPPSFPLLGSTRVQKAYSEETADPHKGILFQKDQHGAVRASLPGKVACVDYMDGYENFVVLDHENGSYTVYGNLQKILVVPGQRVEERERLGMLAPKKGLYFQVNQGKRTQDPIQFLRKGT